MKTYHNRVVFMSYAQEDLPLFKSDEELKDWYETIGRAVMYGLCREAAEDTVQPVTVSLHKQGEHVEVDCVYYRPVPGRNAEEPQYIGSALSEHDEFMRSVIEKARGIGPAFVMGAVRGADGKYGFHS